MSNQSKADRPICRKPLTAPQIKSMVRLAEEILCGGDEHVRVSLKQVLKPTGYISQLRKNLALVRNSAEIITVSGKKEGK